MSTVRFVRKARREVPRVPGGELSLQSPPEVPKVVPGNLLAKMLPLVMVVAVLGMVALMFTSGMAANPMSLLFPVMMVVSMLGMLGGGRGGGTRAAEIDEDRKDYLRYLDQLRRDVYDTGHQQRRALEWTHPDPDLLWTLAGTDRMWERRVNDVDYCHVRVGVGSQRLATRLIAPETGPVEDLEPVAAVSLRRFVRTHSVVPALPTSVSLRGFAAIGVSGDRSAGRDLVRSMLLQLCTFHGPDQVRVAILCGPDTATEWEWAKWLPHAANPEVVDGAGVSRMVFGSLTELDATLYSQFSMRAGYSRGAPAAAGVAQLVVVVDGGILDGESRLADGLDSVTVVDLTGFCPSLVAARGIELVLDRTSPGEVSLGARTGSGVETFAVADRHSVEQAETAARRLAPYRAVAAAGTEADAEDGPPTASWQQLLGISDVAAFDPQIAWAPRTPRERLRVPIGVGADGSTVEIDLKEAAENGMGPHGLCIGATGSGKSEFLRTLVLGLIATHSPAALNLVLVDFKGGATFLGLDRAPHVAAVITNLAEELAMVDRMRDALAGEMNRRQELLRSAGNFANVSDYEKARAAGADLAPLPALFIVVDEFSELLSQQPEFADLFVAIGRLGRSLHMHLLLASQRLEEGKLRGLDSHLSYRIGLKTFSANESRTVLGVPDAYHLPATPGSGYLKCDSAEIMRFAAAYVSGPCPAGRPGAPPGASSAATDLLPRPFTAAPVPLAAWVTERPAQSPPEPAPAEASGRTVLEAVVEGVRGCGPAAHEVWLPPLTDPPTLDQILPGLLEPASPSAGLRATVGVVDRPFDQRRAPLVVDLSGSQGNVAVVGGPQSGKSTALRTLILSLALTHSPRQVQFYCLDFGGGTLAGLAGVPHVGSVANRLDVDRVRRTVAEVSAVLRRREQRFRGLGIDSMAEFRRLRGAGGPDADAVAADPFGDVFLVIDGWPGIRQDFEPLEAQIGALAGQGLSFGVHVVVTASRWGEIRPALKDQLGTRIELRLGDPSDSDMGRAKASRVPEGRPGRGMTRDGLHLLTALPRVDGVARSADLTAGVADTVARVVAAAAGETAPPVRMLPERCARTAMLAAAQWPPADREAPCRRVPIGIGEADLAPAYVDLADQPHLLVFGDGASGKTTLLRGICAGIVESNTPGQAKIIVADYRRTMLGAVEGDHLAGYAASAATLSTMITELAGILAGRMPGPEVTQRQLRERSWWRGPEIYVVVDDYDLVATSSGNPLAPLLDYLPHARDIGLHLLVARRTGGAARALYEPVLARLRELVPVGVVMSGSRDEGALVGAVRASEMPAGRGTFVTRSATALIQVAWLDPL